MLGKARIVRAGNLKCAATSAVCSRKKVCCLHLETFALRFDEKLHVNAVKQKLQVSFSALHKHAFLFGQHTTNNITVGSHVYMPAKLATVAA